MTISKTESVPGNSDAAVDDSALDAAGTVVGANVAEMVSHSASNATRIRAASSPANINTITQHAAPDKDAGKPKAQPGEELSGEGSPGLTLEGRGGHA